MRQTAVTVCVVCRRTMQPRWKGMLPKKTCGKKDCLAKAREFRPAAKGA